MKLKNLFFTLLTLICVTSVPAMAQENAGAAASSQQGALVLTLDDALKIALSESPTVQIADQTIQAKKYAKKGTYAALWPEISASASYQRYIEKPSFHIMGQTVKMGTTNTMAGGFSAAMPFINAQLWKSLKLSGMDVELAVEQARSSRIDMIEQVSKAFYQVLLAKDSYEVYKRVYDNAAENHKIVEKRYSVGQVSEYDFIRSQVNVANAEPNVFNAENTIALALWQLKALLGMDLDVLVDCAGTLADYEAQMSAQIDSQNSLVNNSTLKQLDIQERMLTQNLKIQRAANLPTLAGSINYQWTAMDETMKISNFNWMGSSTAAFSLNVPIFSGGKRRAAINQAKIDLAKMQLQREDAERQLRMAAMSYYSSMQTNLKQYHAASQTISQAKRGYDIAVKRYEVGSGTLVEIDNSQLAYTQAELSRSNAIYNYLINKVSLDKLSGDTYSDNSEEN
ncbi:MAG: TolC family protein [Alistipes sp.]|jgi:outer membrane protein TolC|nr:TolC family protein [Alistipes sp.]MBQ5921746.1 TolC family protein [Alistipes sp.]